MIYNFVFDETKNVKLKAERGIGFEDVIDAIQNGSILDIIPHHNKKDYPNQKILLIKIANYVYQVPYLEEGNTLILKTVFASRKFTKLYLGEI